MNSAFSQFMNGLVDYAGLFPPAKLDMAPAVADYARYLAVPDSWMLGRFICPAARLDEMAACLDGHLDEGSPRWELSVLIGGGKDPATVLTSLVTQAQAIAEIQARFQGRVKVVALEMPIPRLEASLLDQWLTASATVLGQEGLREQELYLEVPAAGQAEDDPLVLEAIRRLRDAAGDDTGPVGAKFRCGGITAEAFPSVDRLAGVISQSRRLDLALKFTAGLHHPVRHRAVEPDVMMHGFLNVFGAGLLAFALDADQTTLTDCLAETDPAAFSFSEDCFQWRDLSVAGAAIGAIRTQYLGGFGSCSFAEPQADLKDLGLL